MSVRVKYQRDPVGMKAMVVSDMVGDACLAAARRGQAWAAGEANRIERDTGEYARSFEARRNQVRMGGRYGGQRAGAVMETTSPIWPYAEKRSMILQRSPDHMGA